MSLNINVTVPLPIVASIMGGRSMAHEQLSHLVIDAVRNLSKAMMEPTISRDDSAIDMSTPLGAEDESTDQREVLRQRGIQKMAAQRPPTKVLDGKGYIEVIWDFHGCYSLLVQETATGAQISEILAEKTGVPAKQQRLTYKEKLFRCSDTLKDYGIQPIYSTANRPRLRLVRLEGLCFEDADMDFWIHIGGSGPERTSKKQLHACHSARLSDIIEAVLPNNYHSSYRLLLHGKVVHGSTREMWACNEDKSRACRTLGTIGVQSGDVLRLQLLKIGSGRSPSITSIFSARSRSSVSSTGAAPAVLERSQSESAESLRSRKKPSLLRKGFTT